MINFFLVLLLIFPLTFSVQAKKSLNLVSFHIPKYVKNNSKGAFIDLVKAITNDLNLDYKIKILPPKRALQRFQTSRANAYFPGLDVLNKVSVHKSIPFYNKRDFIFYRKDKVVKNLHSKKVCLTIGYAYSASVTNRKDIQFVFLSSDQACFKSLMKARVDALIVEEVTGLKTLENLKIKNISYNKNQPISEQDVYFAFEYTPFGDQMAKAFSRSLKKMKQDDSFQKIFKDNQ